MKVFVTGSTGFVGTEIVRQLTSAGHVARCLVRPGSDHKLEIRTGVEVRHGDVCDPESLTEILTGCAAVIHLVGIIREFPHKGITFAKLHTEATHNLIQAAQEQGVKRYIHMSANGAREQASTDYHRTKWAAEQFVRNSELDWTIFRPSMIFGPQDQFVTMLADMMRKLPVIPVMGDGQYRMAPVAVEDVARSFVQALEMPETVGKTYQCCGPEALTYEEILDTIGMALGKQAVTKIHQPLFLMKPIVSILEGLPQFPITRTQLTMLLEGNVCEPGPWPEAFGIAPTSLSEGIQKYISP